MPTGEIAQLEHSRTEAADGERAGCARNNRMTYDADFLAKLRRRDPAACTWFVYTFTPILEAKLRYKLRDLSLIDDLRNETFCRVLTLVDKDRVRDPAQFGSFVRGVCDNVIFEHIRKDKGMTEWPEGFEPLDTMPSINQLLEESELLTLLRCELRKLSHEEEKLITESYLDERDRRMMAEDRGISVSGLNVQLCRTMKPFRQSFLNRVKSKIRTSNAIGEAPNVKSRRSA